MTEGPPARDGGERPARPAPPEKPLPADCCGGGCDRCVYDLYDEALSRYEAALKVWEEKWSGSN